MQVEQVAAEGLKREFKVTVPAGEIEERIRTRLSELAKTVRLPGFRPGKAPLPLLKKQYGRSILGEVLEEAVDEGSKKTIGEQRASSGAAARRSRSPRSTRARTSSSSEAGGAAGGAAGRARRISLTRLVAETPADKVEEAIENFAKSRQKFETPGRAAARAGRRPADDRLRGQDRRHAVRGRRRQGLPAAAGLRRHGARLRGAAGRRRCRRDPRGQGDLPRRLRQPEIAGKDAVLHGHGQRGQGTRSR